MHERTILERSIYKEQTKQSTTRIFFKVMNEKKKKVPHSGYRYFNIISIKQDLEWILQRHIKIKILHIVLKIFTYKYFFVINMSILINADEIMWNDAHSYQNIFDILTSKLSNWTKQYKISTKAFQNSHKLVNATVYKY